MSTGESKLIRLASNENTEPPSPAVREALERAYGDANLSPSPQPPLRLALAKRHGVDPSQVLVTAGSTEVIDAVIRTFARAGSEVVIPDPSWPVFRRRLEAVEARIVDVPLVARRGRLSLRRRPVPRRDHRRDPADRRLQPEQPDREHDGARRPAARRRHGRALAARCGVCRFRPRPCDPMHLVHELPNILITRTFSKAYCLAGLRIGYLVGDARAARLRRPVPRAGELGQHGVAACRPRRAGRRGLPRPPGPAHRRRAGAVALGPRGAGARRISVARQLRRRRLLGARGGAHELAAAVLERGVVVRPLGHLLRISIGRAEENDALVAALRACV